MSKKIDYYKQLKDQGLTDKEIAESFILPVERTEEEEKEDLRILRECIDKERKKNEKTEHP